MLLIVLQMFVLLHCSPMDQSIDNAYTQNTEIASDRIYWDIPPTDFVMFTQARKFLLEAISKIN